MIPYSACFLNSIRIKKATADIRYLQWLFEKHHASDRIAILPALLTIPTALYIYSLTLYNQSPLRVNYLVAIYYPICILFPIVWTQFDMNNASINANDIHS